MKRGLSEIVTTVLISLIVMIIIAILAFVLVPLVQNDSESLESASCFSMSLSPTRCTYSTSHEALVSFIGTRTSGSPEAVLDGVRVVFQLGDETFAFENETPIFAFEQYAFPFQLDFDPENALIAAIAQGSACAPLHDPIACIPSVCGNTILEAGEQCDGSSAICYVNTYFRGSALCTGACMAGACFMNPQCSDEFDNDQDGFCDDEGFSNRCSPTGVNGDNGCWSSDDNDEGVFPFSIIINSPSEGEVYQTIDIDSYERPLEFAIAYTPEEIIDAADDTLDSCWYTLGGVTNMLDCSGVVIVTNLSFSSGGSQTLTIYANDSTGDVASKSISFSVIESTLELVNPVDGSYVTNPNVLINFTFGSGFVPTSCSYQLANSTGSISDSPIPGCAPFFLTMAEESYMLSLSAINSGGLAVSAQSDFIVNLCPGDFTEEGDSIPTGDVNSNDLNVVLQQWSPDTLCNPINVCPGDANYDGYVDEVDLFVTLQNFGKSCNEI